MTSSEHAAVRILSPGSEGLKLNMSGRMPWASIAAIASSRV